jgi:hypothetical protein
MELTTFQLGSLKSLILEKARAQMGEGRRQKRGEAEKRGLFLDLTLDFALRASRDFCCKFLAVEVIVTRSAGWVCLVMGFTSKLLNSP